MAAILGGTMRSPFTGIVFALELTHAWGTVLPLIIAVAISHAFTVLVLGRSILTEKVARRGFHLSREYATDPLEILFVREVMQTKVPVLPSSLTRAQLLHAIDGEHELARLFYVVDADQKLLGVVTRGRVEAWMTGQAEAIGAGGPQSGLLAEAAARSARTVGEIARKAVVSHEGETLRTAMHRMALTAKTRLPVVAKDDPQTIVGEICLEDTLKAGVKHLEEEQRRERVLPLTAMVPKWLKPKRAA
jgi:CBS domain-containing protein